MSMKAQRMAGQVLLVTASGHAPLDSAMWRAQCDRGLRTRIVAQRGNFDDAPDDCRLLLVYDRDLDDAAVGAVGLALRRRFGDRPMILATVCGSEHRAVVAMRGGYSDYLHADTDIEEWHALLRKTFVPSTAGVGAAAGAGGLVCASPAMRAIDRMVSRFAPSDCTVLIMGETGTGKERIAERIHALSPRCGRVLLPINCAALPDSLLESELFGYEKGAFTGAVSAYPGKLKLAEGGTLFLDEIGDMSPQGQAKLLRAMESREFYRLGARESTRFDVRIVAATNQPIDRLVDEGKFRKDLFFRMNVARIDLPPLRERREDIEPLLRHYLGEYGARNGCAAEFEPELMASLVDYDWPGNIRELRNLVEMLVICARGDRIAVEHLPLPMRARLGGRASAPSGERDLLLSTLARLNWNKSQTARSLHWSRMTLYRKLEKYAIQAPDAIEGDDTPQRV
jgi:DNA-binding NtrC family response regulator